MKDMNGEETLERDNGGFTISEAHELFHPLVYGGHALFSAQLILCVLLNYITSYFKVMK